MNERDKLLFLKGLEVGLKLSEEYGEKEAREPEPERVVVKRGKRMKKYNHPGNWSEEEDAILRANRDLQIKQLVPLLPKRSLTSITTRRSTLGIKRTYQAQAVPVGIANLGQNNFMRSE